MMWLELRLRLAATIMVKSRPFWAGQVFKVGVFLAFVVA